MKLYPFLFEPNLHSVVWGGDFLCRWKGMEAAGQPIGESWEVSAVPSSPSVIANGELKGQNLIAAIEQCPEEILGRHVARDNDNRMPLLVKFIDARQDLSIQVHPNDEMASRIHGKRGKTEMWYVIDAAPGAFLYAGFSRSLAPDNDSIDALGREKAMQEYRRLLAEGTITEVLAKHEVHAGDVFYLPAGRVHAICSGILLAEVQQSSDVTYRIFDYNRPGTDGKMRELHTEFAAQALDYHVEPDYRSYYRQPHEEACTLTDSAFFRVNLIDASHTIHRDLLSSDSFVILMCLQGDCRVKMRATGTEMLLREGYSTLVPAVMADYELCPAQPGNSTRVLEALAGE